jgi:hypothetical protein
MGSRASDRGEHGRQAGADIRATLVVLLEKRLGLQHKADELIEADLHQPYLDGVPAPIDRGAHPALSHSSQSGRRHP